MLKTQPAGQRVVRWTPVLLSCPQLWILSAAGTLCIALLAGLILLFTNIPAGYQMTYIFSPKAVTLFRAFWPYPQIALEPAVFTRLALLTMFASWAVYLMAAGALKRGEAGADRRGVLRLIVAYTFAATALVAILLPPVLSADVFNYALYGRMVTFHGLNPYLLPGDAVAGDPLRPFVDWGQQTSRYGPVWTLLSAGMAWLGGQSVLGTIYAFKGLAALCHLLNCALVYMLARRLAPHYAVEALLLYAWNPLILIESAGSAHNDVVMMTLALAGLLLAFRGQRLAGIGLLLASVLTKYVTLLLLALCVVYLLGRVSGRRRRLALTAGLGAVGLGVAVACYGPFWAGFDRLGSLAAGWSTGLNSKPNPLILLLQAAAARFLTLMGGQGDPAKAGEHLAGLTLSLGFAALMAYLLVRTGHPTATWSLVVELWAISTLIYIICVYGGTYPWYMVSILTIVTLYAAPPWRGRLSAATVGLSVGFMALYAPLFPWPT